MCGTSWIPEDEAKMYPGTSFAATENGWMQKEVFRKYFQDIFLPNILEQRPVLLLYDGHSTHIDVDIILQDIEHEVIILKLPPHSSHLLQPLDLCVFKGLKDDYDQLLVKWHRRLPKSLPNCDFAELMSKAWQREPKENIQAGFRKGGIFPFNRKVIPESIFEPGALQRYRKKYGTYIFSILAAGNSSTSTVDILTATQDSVEIPTTSSEMNLSTASLADIDSI